MKIKILVVPFLIVIIAVFSIWLVYPAYSNGTTGVKENYAKLKSEQAKLAEIQTISENIDKLSAQISTMPEKESLYSFVPENGKEDEIINNLVKLASLSGLFFFESSIEQPVSKNIQEAIQTEDEFSVGTQTSLFETQNFKTKVKLMGNYEKIKEFLVNLEKLERNNNLEMLEIKRNVVENSSEDPNAVSQDSLAVNATLNFALLKKNKLSQSNATDPVFSSPKLETEIIKEIKNKKNISNFQLNVEQKGKINIFQL